MKRIQRTLASLCLLPLAACNCESSPIDRLEPVLEHEPGLLDLGELPLGVRGQGAVTVRSRGSAMLTLTAVRLEGDPLFKLANEIMRNLPPSTSDVVLVEARPSELGERLGTLILESDDPLRTLVRITVRVVGVPQPPCDDNNPCTADAFDPELDDCVHSFQDGVACQPADHCIVGAVCSQGVCLGATKTCDDQSACTRDFCRQTTGECVFLAEPMACDDANPCTADSCQGDACAHEPVANGIACEDGDSCTTGDACFAGACRGSGRPEGSACDDLDSCTVDDTCTQGQCRGRSILTGVAEGEEVFRYPLTTWDDAFLHRREVSLSDDGVYFGLDHLPATNPPGLIHEIFAMHQCGTPLYVFDYRPPDSHVLVRFVRREMQLERDRSIRVVVGVRQLPDDGYRPETTTYVLDPDGRVQFSSIQALGGETGRALLPDGSHIYGTIFPLSFGPPTPEDPARQNLIIVREDRFGNVLWRHERDSGDWSEFLGVAGPRVLFWARGNFGALDFNTSRRSGSA